MAVVDVSASAGLWAWKENLELDTQTIGSYGEFSGLKNRLNKRMSEINKFLKGTKRQLNVKDW